MPRTYSIDEAFADESDEDVQQLETAEAEPSEGAGSFTIDEAFLDEAPTPDAQPATQTGGKSVPGVPYPVAPPDAFGLPADLEQPSAVTRFFEELPGVAGDVAQATKGVIRDTLWEDMTEDERAAGKRLFEDLRVTQATRAPLQGAMQFSQAIQGAVNRPLALAGMDGADENANAAKRIVDALGEENSRRAATGLIAQAFGETAGKISESVISSLVEQYLGGRFLKGAGLATTPARAAMVYTGLSAGNDALTEATDMGLEGAKRWGYAGTIGALNSAFIWAGGKIAKGLGVETAEEAMFKPAVNAALAKAGTKGLLERLINGTTGAVLEGGEEYGTELSTGLTRAIFDGPPESALDRIGRKLNDKQFQKDVAVAGLTGVGARSAIGTMKALGESIERAKELLPGEMAAAAEAQSDPDGEQEAEIPPAEAPAVPPGAPGVPDQAQTAAPAAAPPEAPQGAPLTPESEAAAVAPPSAEATAGVPPSEAPATPPGEPLWRETDAASVLAMVDPNTVGDMPFGAPELFFSDNPDLALGQGANKGVRVEVDSQGLNKREHQKPGTQVPGAGKEFVVSQQPSELRDRVKSVTITADADKKSGEIRRLRNVLKQQGFTPVETEAGEVWSRQAAPTTPPGEPPVPPAPPTGAGPSSSDADTIKLANASMDQLARMLGRGESYYSPGTRGLREAAVLAEQAGIPDKAVSIATDILENGRQLTSVEEAGLGSRVVKLTAKLQQNRKQMAAATDEAEVKSLAAEANTLGEEFDIIREALRMGGTDPARVLAYRRWLFPDDLDEGTIVSRVKTARKGPATEEDKKFAKDVAKQHTDNAAKLDKARGKNKEDIANAAIKAMKAEGAPAQPVDSINARIKELLDQGCDLV